MISSVKSFLMLACGITYFFYHIPFLHTAQWSYWVTSWGNHCVCVFSLDSSSLKTSTVFSLIIHAWVGGVWFKGQLQSLGQELTRYSTKLASKRLPYVCIDVVFGLKRQNLILSVRILSIKYVFLSKSSWSWTPNFSSFWKAYTHPATMHSPISPWQSLNYL